MDEDENLCDGLFGEVLSLEVVAQSEHDVEMVGDQFEDDVVELDVDPYGDDFDLFAVLNG